VDDEAGESRYEAILNGWNAKVAGTSGVTILGN
jgi:hypothetical protein